MVLNYFENPKIFIDTSSKKISPDEFNQIKASIKNDLSSDNLVGLQTTLKRYADYVTDNVSVLDLDS